MLEKAAGNLKKFEQEFNQGLVDFLRDCHTDGHHGFGGSCDLHLHYGSVDADELQLTATGAHEVRPDLICGG